MYILLIAFGIVLLMHSFLLVAVIRKNEELNKKINAMRRGSYASSPSGKRRMMETYAYKQSPPSKKDLQI